MNKLTEPRVAKIRAPRSLHTRPSVFTLVELLVVIGIFVMLLLAPCLSFVASSRAAGLLPAADDRPAIRASFGVRDVHADGPQTLIVRIGLSVTPAAGVADAYRIISAQDPAYAYEKFMRPNAAKVTQELEAEALEGAPLGPYRRAMVTLTLPVPMHLGMRYTVVAQGSAGVMVTGARTAASVVYDEKAPAPSDENAVNLAVLGLRQADPVGSRLLRLEFGPDFAPAAATPAAFHVSLGGKPVEVLRLGRISKLDTYLPVGWPFKAIPMHEIFLELAQPLVEGQTVDIQVDPTVTSANRTTSFDFTQDATISQSIKVNQVGYLSESPVKIAYLGRWLGSFPEPTGAKAAAPSLNDAAMQFDQAILQPADNSLPAQTPTAPADDRVVVRGAALWFATPPPFSVRALDSRQIVYTGTAKLVHQSGEQNEGWPKIDYSGENVYQLDFTAFHQPGRYFLSVPGVGRSLLFDIGDNVYDGAFKLAALGVFQQRSGIALGPPFTPWRRIADQIDGIIVTNLTGPNGTGAQHILEIDPAALPKHIIYQPVPAAAADPAQKALDDDAALIAHWPLNGDLQDHSGHHHDLTAAAPSPFVKDNMFGPEGTQVLGPASKPGVPLASAEIVPDITKGFTMTAWLKATGSDVYHATWMGFGPEGAKWEQPKFLIGAGWGVINAVVGARAGEFHYERLQADQWYHVSLVVPPPTATPRQAALYVDGKAVTHGDISDQVNAGPFRVGVLQPGQEATAQLYVADIRLYQRALQDDQITVLARPHQPKPVKIMASGGHHDAGDFNPRSHLDVAQILLNAYEMTPAHFYDGQVNLPESGQGIPDIVSEAEWALKLWKGLQESDGGVHDGTESRHDVNFIQTVDLDDTGDYTFAPDAAASYEAAGAFAQAARVYRLLGRDAQADDYLRRARLSYDWASAHPPANVGNAAAYAQTWAAPKAYAAAEMLHTTGEARFNKDFAAVAVWARDSKADLERYQLYDQSRAAWAYVNCPAAQADEKLQQAARAAILRQADQFIEAGSTMAYGFVLHPYAPISWGTGTYLDRGIPVAWAYQLTKDERYRYWLIRSADNTLGANPLDLSWITGLGGRTIHAPLHSSRYGEAGEVAPGMQAEGPNQHLTGYAVAETFYPQRSEKMAVLQDFVDAHYAIDMNEPMVPSQAMTVAIFGFLLPDHAAAKPR